jgi:hypothetical protein
MARPVDWSSTTITVLRAEGRTLTCALAIFTPGLLISLGKRVAGGPAGVQQIDRFYTFFSALL